MLVFDSAAEEWQRLAMDKELYGDDSPEPTATTSNEKSSEAGTEQSAVDHANIEKSELVKGHTGPRSLCPGDAEHNAGSGDGGKSDELEGKSNEADDDVEDEID